MAFGPDGNLYATGFNNNEVLEYDGTTGAFIKDFVSGDSAGLSTPTFLVFQEPATWFLAGISMMVLGLGAVREPSRRKRGLPEP